MRRRATNRPVSTTTARMQKPSTGLGMLPSRPRNPLREPKSKPNIIGSGTGEPVDPRAERVAREAELLDGDGGRQRHHRQRHTSHAQRGDAGDEAQDGRHDDARDRADREVDPEVGGEVRDREARRARQRDLRERHLPDVAGDDDEREADDDAGHRDDQRVPVVERQHDERDDADDDRDDRRAEEALGARGLRAGPARRSHRASAGSSRATTARSTMMTNVTSALTPGSAAPWSVGNQLCVEK